jgi:lipoate-protein ligase A
MEIGTYNFDDELIRQTIADCLPRVTVYRIEETAIVLGRSSKEEDELNVEAVLEDGVPVLRRRGGGCAVVLDPGNVIVSVVLPAMGSGKIREYFSLISDWIIWGLGEAGFPGVEQRGISDLALEERKIAGASMEQKKNYVYYTTSVLYDPDIGLMEKYLKHPPREPEYRKHRTHAEFAASLKDQTGERDIELFIQDLQAALSMDVLMELDARRGGLIFQVMWMHSREWPDGYL